MTAFVAEITGTGLLVLLGGGVNANVLLKDMFGHNSGWLVITTGWALGVFAGVVVAGPVSGAHLNPAVTLSLAMSGSFPWAKVPSYILAEFVGAMLGAGLVWLTAKDHFDRTPDVTLKRGVFCTAPAIRSPLRNLLCEAVGTFVLIAIVLFKTDAKVGLGAVGALPVALIVWSIGLSLGGTTGYAINPARDLGPRLMHTILPIKGKGSSDWGYAWVPLFGPLIGASLAVALFLAV